MFHWLVTSTCRNLHKAALGQCDAVWEKLVKNPRVGNKEGERGGEDERGAGRERG